MKMQSFVLFSLPQLSIVQLLPEFYNLIQYQHINSQMFQQSQYKKSWWHRRARMIDLSIELQNYPKR